MKKFLAILLCVCMVVAIVACNKTEDTETPTTEAPTEAPTQAPANTPEEPKEAEYKLGMGVVVGMSDSSTQVDATVAAVVTDADGKIVACRIDVAQNKFDLTKFETESAKVFETKRELKERYNMAAYGTPNVEGGTVLEWYVQAEAFEKYVVGMTAAEVSAIELKEVNHHMIAVDEALLSAGCTMQITDFMEAIAKACADEQGMTFKTAEEFTLGVAAKTALDSKTVAATAEKNGQVHMYTDFACAVVAGGKVIATLNDAIQPNSEFTVENVVVKNTFKGTKRELKEAYNMAAYGQPNIEGGTVLEWYVQSAAFSKHVVGMTAAEILAMETTEVNHHFISTDADLLAAGCTMQITGICAVVAQAAEYAR